MTVAEALRYLRARGVVVEVAPKKFQRRGFDYYAPGVGQMLSTSDLIEFAHNERELDTAQEG
jgi:hypothetical protein